jgi:hypothetical protein
MPTLNGGQSRGCKPESDHGCRQRNTHELILTGELSAGRASSCLSAHIDTRLGGGLYECPPRLGECWVDGFGTWVGVDGKRWIGSSTR